MAANPPPAPQQPPAQQPPAQAGYVHPCDVTGVPLTLLNLGSPDTMFDAEQINAAGVVLLAYQYGDVLRMLPAVEVARARLGTDELFVTDRGILRDLHCWPELHDRVRMPERAALAASIWGVRAPGVPDDQRDPDIQPMMAALLRAVRRTGRRRRPRAAEVVLVEQHARAVQAHLTARMTSLTVLRAQDLGRQMRRAVGVLDRLAPHMPLPLPAGVTADRWAALEVLLGDELRAAGVDVVIEAMRTRALRTVVEWLAAGAGGGPGPKCTITRKVRRAAEVLRSPLPGSASLDSGAR